MNKVNNFNFYSIPAMLKINTRKSSQLAILPITALVFSLGIFSANSNAQSDIQRFDPYYRAYSNVTANTFRAGVPAYHVVQPGETYYSIAQRYLNDPRGWASAWELPSGMTVNQNGQLQPGSIVVLSNTRDAKLRWFPQGESALAKRQGSYYGVRTGHNSMKLLPVAWAVGNKKEQVLPPNTIEPFIAKATVVPYADIYDAPLIAGFVDSRLMAYPGKTAYVRGNIDENIKEWYVYRPGEELIDPETYRSLGFVSRLQGIVMPIRRSPDAYEFEVIAGNLEIERGARLIPVERQVGYQEFNYQRPNSDINARVVGVYDGSIYSHQYRTIIINRGAEHGVKRGDVFTLQRHSPVHYKNEYPLYDIPLIGYGQIYVFRVEANTSFALVLAAEGEIELYDFVRPVVDDSYNDGLAQDTSQDQSLKLSPQVYSSPIQYPQPLPTPAYRISR